MASRAFTERNNAKNRLIRTERIRKMSKALSSHSQMQRFLYRKTIKGQNLNRNQERGGGRTGKRTLTNMPTPDHKKTRAPNTQAVAKKRLPPSLHSLLCFKRMSKGLNANLQSIWVQSMQFVSQTAQYPLK